MCPLRLIPRLFLFDDEELLPELRAQRTLNKARVPDIARYIVANPKGYVFSALTASVDADVRFESFEESDPAERIGLLTIPMSARFVINDGQHRRAAIEQALRENPDLGDESIAVVLFLDVGLGRCQQMFADLNRYAIRPAPSLGVLYDQREDLARIVRTAVFQSRLFRELIETEKSNLSMRSRKLFTLSSLYTGTKALLEGFEETSFDERLQLAQAFWDAVCEQFPDWARVAKQEMTAGEIRRDFIHAHGVALHAIGRVGNGLLRQSTVPARWQKKVRLLQSIDWLRANAALWEGRALLGGKMSNTSANVVLTTNAIRIALGQRLSADELRAEEAFRRGES